MWIFERAGRGRSTIAAANGGRFSGATRRRGSQGRAAPVPEAARGTFDPAYLNYTLGKLMIRKLRSDWTAAHGGRAAWKAFHDQFLSYGGPPVPMVRKAMGVDGPAL